jgi:hypothetical protein
MFAEQPASTARGLKNPLRLAAASASRPERPKSAQFTFEREDWTLFRSLSTLGQKAGVRVHLLPKLERSEIAGMYRDPRGTLYHPHRRDSMPLGTCRSSATSAPSGPSISSCSSRRRVSSRR